MTMAIGGCWTVTAGVCCITMATGARRTDTCTGGVRLGGASAIRRLVLGAAVLGTAVLGPAVVGPVVIRRAVERALDVLWIRLTPVQGIAPAAVRQGERGGAADVCLVDLVSPVERRERARGTRRHEIATYAVDSQRGAGACDAQQLALGQANRIEALARLLQTHCQLGLLLDV